MSAVGAEALAALAGVVGDANVVTDAGALAAAAERLSAGDLGLLQAVARPRSAAEVGELVRLARGRGFALVTMDGALGAMRESVLLDLSHLQHVAINRTNLTADAQAGVTLGALEERLNRERLTLGPLPPAIMGLSVSEWLGRRGGFFPTSRFGSFNDLVPAISGVLAGGEAFAGHRAPGNAGLGLDHLIIGSRGLFAVITGATLSIRPVPAWSRLRAFVAPDFAAGLEAVRRVCASGHLPAQARLFDEPGTAVVAARAGINAGGALLLLEYEGEDSALSRVRAKQAFHLAAASCRELPAAEADQCLAAAGGVPSPGVQVGAGWSALREVLDALTAAGATGAALVFVSPTGTVLGFPADTDEAAARLVAAAEPAGGVLLGPRSGWPFSGPPAHRRILREWKLRLDPGLVLNPALLPEEVV